ncbi:MAG TPA: hypothetical protein VN176_05040 [Verrucomicrobiae bacterium]|jgi:hypothetical protein|nr:hypothetical protein [Verrucomicrobiae bacterium]
MMVTLFSRHSHLYRTRRFQASVALLLACALAVSVAAQHRNAHKLRATGIVEITTDAYGAKKIRLTAITVLDHGRYHDGSIYESKPRPMALENGVVYEVQKSGMPVAYLAITNSEEANGIWVAGGNWQLPAKPRPTASATPVSAAGDDRPRIRRADSSTAQPAQPPAPSTTGTQAPNANPPAPDDRPVMHRRESGASDPAATPPAASPGTQTAGTNPPVAPVPETPQERDPSRPTLRHRGTTAQQQQELENQPVLSPGTQRAAEAVLYQPAGQGTQTLVGVSDEQPSENRSYDFVWKPGEQVQIEAKMRKLVLQQFPRETPALTDSSFKNLSLRAFDLDMSNDAAMVLTAELPPAQQPPVKKISAGHKAAPAPEAPPAKPATRYITLIARIDIDGNPTKLLANVTDSSHLDVVPRLELIDAVDVDGAGPAELLFREYGFYERAFVIYGVSHGVVTKLFEGASQPLR